MSRLSNPFKRHEEPPIPEEAIKILKCTVRLFERWKAKYYPTLSDEEAASIYPGVTLEEVANEYATLFGEVKL